MTDIRYRKSSLRANQEVHKDWRLATAEEKKWTMVWYPVQRNRSEPVRSSDPQSSHDAVPEEGRLLAIRELYFQVVEACGEDGATTDEVHQATDVPTNSLNSRAKELCCERRIVIALENEDGVEPKRRKGRRKAEEESDDQFRERLARNLYEMFEMRTNRSWDQVGEEGNYPGMHAEWLSCADELIERMGDKNEPG
jgi:hypothetical protein